MGGIREEISDLVVQAIQISRARCRQFKGEGGGSAARRQALSNRTVKDVRDR